MNFKKTNFQEVITINHPPRIMNATAKTGRFIGRSFEGSGMPKNYQESTQTDWYINETRNDSLVCISMRREPQNIYAVKTQPHAFLDIATSTEFEEIEVPVMPKTTSPTNKDKLHKKPEKAVKPWVCEKIASRFFRSPSSGEKEKESCSGVQRISSTDSYPIEEAQRFHVFNRPISVVKQNNGTHHNNPMLKNSCICFSASDVIGDGEPSSEKKRHCSCVTPPGLPPANFQMPEKTQKISLKSVPTKSAPAKPVSLLHSSSSCRRIGRKVERRRDQNLSRRRMATEQYLNEKTESVSLQHSVSQSLGLVKSTKMISDEISISTFIEPGASALKIIGKNGSEDLKTDQDEVFMRGDNFVPETETERRFHREFLVESRQTFSKKFMHQDWKGFDSKNSSFSII